MELTDPSPKTTLTVPGCSDRAATEPALGKSWWTMQSEITLLGLLYGCNMSAQHLHKSRICRPIQYTLGSGNVCRLEQTSSWTSALPTPYASKPVCEMESRNRSNFVASNEPVTRSDNSAVRERPSVCQVKSVGYQESMFDLQTFRSHYRERDSSEIHGGADRHAAPIITRRRCHEVIGITRT